MALNHNELLNESLENLNAQAEKLKSLTEVYRKTDEINEKFSQNLGEFRSLSQKWTEFFSEQKDWQSNLSDENSRYFQAFDRLKKETELLAKQLSEMLSAFVAYKENINRELSSLQVEVSSFKRAADELNHLQTQKISQTLAEFGTGLRKLESLEKELSQNEQKNTATLAALEKNSAAVKTQTAEFLRQITENILQNIEQINLRNKELISKFEQMVQRQEASIAQAMLTFTQKAEHQFTQLDLQLTQHIAAVSRKLEQSTQFSQNQMQRTEELFRDMQLRAEEKNTFFAKQISDLQELSSRFASATDDKIERLAKDNRKFYGDLEDGLRVRIEQLKGEFQIKVREELETHIQRSDRMMQTQLGEFQNRAEERAEGRFRATENKFFILLVAMGLNFMALLFLILTK
jgi:chromosome segregation ATPase